MIDALLEKRVLVVGGKGGVGKSTIAAGLGLLAAERGKRVIIAEMSGAEAMSAMFGREPVGYQGGELGPGLSAMSVTPAEASEEYLIRMLRGRSLYDAVFKNRLVEPFMDAVVGLGDLISIGKVMDLEWEREDGSVGTGGEGSFRYDLVIVDAPATGHGLSLLSAPKGMMDVARVGPLYKNAKLVHDLVTDHERTGAILVTLAEEMPVSETLDAAVALRKQVGIDLCALVVNAVPPKLLVGDGQATLWPQLKEAGQHAGGPLLAAMLGAEQALRDRERAEGHIGRLRGELDLPLVEIPLLGKRDMDRDSLREIVAVLKGWQP